MSHSPEPITLTASEVEAVIEGLIVAHTYWQYPTGGPREFARKLYPFIGHAIEFVPVEESA